VKILRGDFKGHEGKVENVDPKNYQLFIDGVSVQKPDGNQVYHPVHPSNTMILELNLDDEKRNKITERKG
jgi:large subunit ribosomal protein L24